MLADQFARAKKIVEGHRQEVERIAEALLRNGYLSTEAVEELIAQQPRVKLVDELKERAG